MKHQLSYMILLFLLVGCARQEIDKYNPVQGAYDPSRPREITGIYPSGGGIGELFVIEGNFGDDLSKMKVYFAGDREAVLIATNGESIYGIVPKQPDGKNSVVVVVQDETITSEYTFDYTVYERVSTISGAFNVDQHVDGNIFQARYGVVTAICLVAGDNIIVNEYWSGRRVRFVSQTESEVTTLGKELPISQPIADRTGEVAYAVGTNENAHAVYVMERSNGWVPRQFRNTVDMNVFSGNINDCALADDEEWLYVRDTHNNFGRISLTEKDEKGNYKIELLITGDRQIGSDYTFLSWSTFEKCFYASAGNRNGVFKIYEDSDGSWIEEQYAGFNRSGYVDGDRIRDAEFATPFGITVGDNGDIYLVELNNDLVRKIDHQTGFVSTVAGIKGGPNSDVRKEEINGAPLESTFFAPHSIRVDSDGNFIIAGGDANTIRKLAIE